MIFKQMDGFISEWTREFLSRFGKGCKPADMIYCIQLLTFDCFNKFLLEKYPKLYKYSLEGFNHETYFVTNDKRLKIQFYKNGRMLGLYVSIDGNIRLEGYDNKDDDENTDIHDDDIVTLEYSHFENDGSYLTQDKMEKFEFGDDLLAMDINNLLAELFGSCFGKSFIHCLINIQ